MFHIVIMLWISLIYAQAYCFTCPIQYEPNNYVSDLLSFVDFDGSPLLYGPDYIEIPTAFTAIVNVTNIDQFVGGVLETDSYISFALISNAPYASPIDGGLEFSARFQYEGQLINGTIPSPLGFQQDPAYAYVAFGALTPYFSSSWILLFLVTNTKIYALYGYGWYYLIPVANKDPADYITYSIVIDSRTSVSWRLDNREVLRISPLTQPIDPRFLIFGVPSDTPPAPLTELSTYLVQGSYRNSTLPVCQRALFNQCSQRLRHAFGTECQYATPVGDVIWYIQQRSEWTFISVSNYTRLDGCPTPENCSPQAVTCPHVKPARCHRQKPVTSTTRTTTTRLPTSTSTTVIPTKTRSPCGCNFDLHF